MRLRTFCAYRLFEGLGGRFDGFGIAAPDHELHPEAVLAIERIAADGDRSVLVLNPGQRRRDAGVGEAEPGRLQPGPLRHQLTGQTQLAVPRDRGPDIGQRRPGLR